MAAVPAIEPLGREYVRGGASAHVPVRQGAWGRACNG